MNAKAIWVKKQVNNKQLPFYEASPGYRTLYMNDTGAIVAFRIIDTEEIPDTIQVCNLDESTKLENKRIKTLADK